MEIFSFVYIFLLLIVVLLAFIYWKFIYPEKRIYDKFKAQGIDGEPFVPLVGQLAKMREYRSKDRVMQFQQDLNKKYGNLCLFCFGPTMRLMVTEPDLLADILSRNNADNYCKPPIFNQVFAPIIGEHNLLVSEGEEHDRARRMINPAFHHVSLKSMISIIADQTAKTIEKLLSRPNEELTVDLQYQFNALTLSIIASSAFGSAYESIEGAKETICRTFGGVLDAIVYRSLFMINQIPFLSKLPFMKKDIVDRGARVIAELVDQIIANRRQGRSTSMSDGADLLDLLLSAVDDDGRAFTDREIKEEALAFVLAGSETTGNLMSWIFYILLTHEDVFQACREEVDRVLSDDIEPRHEHLSQLVICESVINETLRLYPPAPVFTRYCTHDHTIGTERPLFIPKGATILVNSYVLHRRSDLWPRSEEFDYRRWLRDPKTGLKPKLPHPFAYLPFAAGPRNCIGQNFALLEAKIMLAMFIQRCDFKFVTGQKIVPDLKVTMRPKYGLLVQISRRERSKELLL